MKKPVPPGKGQRSIASFFRKPNSNDPNHPRPTIDDKNTENNASDSPQTTIAPEIKPAKRPKHATAEAKANLHQKWQTKLARPQDNRQDDSLQQAQLQNTDEETQTLKGATTPPISTKNSKQSQNKFTPLELQVKELKKKHTDCLLVIECGYKYRFFGQDAEIASQILGIFAYQDRNYLTASIPTYTIDRHIRRLVDTGYKVGLVQQTESAAIKAASDSRNKPFERKLTALFTQATIEAGGLSIVSTPSSTQPSLSSASQNGHTSDAPVRAQHSSYLVCVVEDQHPHQQKYSQLSTTLPTNHSSPITNSTEKTLYSGVGAVDIALVAIECSTGNVLYSQFRDSAMRSELESRLMLTPPSDLLIVPPLSIGTRRVLEKKGATLSGGGGGLIQKRMESVESTAGYGAAGGALARVVEFYSSKRGDDNNNNNVEEKRDGTQTSLLDKIISLPPLVVTALAHSLDYLKPFGLESVLKYQNSSSFREYSEIQELSLSPNTLEQLEILSNSVDGKERGSLLWLMDRTLTAPGSRLMRRWVSRPLTDVKRIRERLDAVTELLSEKGASHAVLSTIPSVLKSLPDIERLLGRVLHQTATSSEFILLLKTFENLYSRLGLDADLAIDTSTTPNNNKNDNNNRKKKNEEDGMFSIAIPRDITTPYLATLLQGAANLQCAIAARQTLASIDANAAASNDILNLFADDERFADVAEKRKNVAVAEETLKQLLPGIASALKMKTISYVSVHNQGEYLIEIPVDMEGKAPKQWEKISSTKKVVRFRPPEVKVAVGAIDVAKEHLAIAAQKAWRQLLGEFRDSYYMLFRDAAQALATLDCLNSFSSLAAAGNYVRPQFVDTSTENTIGDDSVGNGLVDAIERTPEEDGQLLHIENGRHPVLDILLEGSFVPNDIHLHSDRRRQGGERPERDATGHRERCHVITGPNMGGKSCFIRQAALIVIMAQAGCYVPASVCKLNVFDAIFTRMGAADNIALGRSTFLEELSEASVILSTATARSLVIIDELGRGTSTHDGMAIAHATLEYIVDAIGCLCLFVTHYPEIAMLTTNIYSDGLVGSYYMAHLVEDGDDVPANASAAAGGGRGGASVVKKESDRIPKVTFLYRATRGVASASYGLNVARMAGLPLDVVQVASLKAKEMKNMMNKNGDDETVSKLHSSVVVPELKGLIDGNGDDVGDKLKELQRKVKESLSHLDPE